MSLKDRHLENLRNLLNAGTINHSRLVQKLIEITSAGWEVKIRTFIKDRQRVCDGNCRSVFRESQLYQAAPCRTHGFCSNCLYLHIELKLNADPFNLQYIYCPKCEYEGNPIPINPELIRSNFNVQAYQENYIQKRQGYMNSDIYYRDPVQTAASPLIGLQTIQNDVIVGDAINSPQLSDTSSGAIAFRRIFDLLNAIKNNVKIRIETTKEILNQRMKHEFNELKILIQGASYRAISEFMSLDSALEIAYSNFKQDNETGFYKFLKKITQAPAKDKDCFIECELLTEGDIIAGKPKKGDADKTENPKIYSDEDFYYVSKHEGILMLCIAQTK